MTTDNQPLPVESLADALQDVVHKDRDGVRAAVLPREGSMTKPYEIRTTSLTVAPVGEPTFSEMATTVEICDEAAGEFVEVTQHGRVDIGKIQINPEEWPSLREAIDRMIKACRKDE